MTTVAARNSCASVSASIVWQMSGRPAQGRYCFGIAPPSRAPRPAATTMRETLGDKAGLRGCRTLRRSIGEPAPEIEEGGALAKRRKSALQAAAAHRHYHQGAVIASPGKCFAFALAKRPRLGVPDNSLVWV